VEPNQEKQNWYHQRFRRVPTIDQCYTDDAVCRFEADQQFRRDRMVDNEIVNILRQRFEDCTLYEAPDHIVKCKPLLEQYEKATENWFIKCEWNPYMGHLDLSFEWPLIDRSNFRWRLGRLCQCQDRIHEAEASPDLGASPWTRGQWHEGGGRPLNSAFMCLTRRSELMFSSFIIRYN